MEIKHMGGRTKEEQISALRSYKIHEDLIKACEKNDEILKQIVDILIIPGDIYCPPEQAFARTEARVKLINDLFTSLRSAILDTSKG